MAFGIEKDITVKGLSKLWGIPERTIHNSIDRCFPGLKKNGKAILLNQDQLSVISKDMKKAHNSELAITGKVIEIDWIPEKEVNEARQQLTALRRAE
jgi:transcriptional antiterminator